MDLTASKGLNKVRRWISDKVIILALLMLIVIISIINPRFLSLQVLRDVALQNSTRLIIACGMAFILISGGVDLSAGRIVGLAAVITASLGQTMEYARRFYPEMGNIPIIVPFFAAIAITSILGLFNGFVIAKFKIVPFIVTLGTQVMAWGINLLYFDIPPNKSQPIGGIKGSITWLGSGIIPGTGIPVIIVIALAICAICWFVLAKLRFGRNVYAVGGNQESAMVSGIRVDLNLIGVYMLAGTLYGIAGFLECCRTGGATSAYGLNYEFDAISACVVGGVSNTGGIGTIPGMILGVLVFGIINYGLTFIGVNPYWQNIIKGLIIIAAVGFDIRKNIRRK
ncbi:MAG: beta-methylgalactoside transporter [Treponema sp.]|jgi:methyl-galactoside transport system permease protein|nr:beta-methylgalactoside transporter [Treponema sp.]